MLEEMASEITAPEVPLTALGNVPKFSNLVMEKPESSKNGFISATMKVCGRASRTGFDMGYLNELVSIPSLSRRLRHLLHRCVAFQ